MVMVYGGGKTIMKMKNAYDDNMRWTRDADRLAKKVTSILGDTIDDALKEFTTESAYYIIDGAVKLQIVKHIVSRELRELGE